MKNINENISNWVSTYISEISENKITKTYNFKKASLTDLDEIDASFERVGIKSNPDFNKKTITVSGDKNKIDKILKFYKRLLEGNAFTGALYKARKEGLKEFEFNGKKYPVYEEKTEEETITEGVWSKIMKSVQKGGPGPWSIVAIKNNKVIGQKINIKIKDSIPAHYEGMKRDYPGAFYRIEDSEGQIVLTGK